MMEKRWAGAITEIICDGQTAQYHFRVQGQSMVPTLHPGDEVIVERTSLEVLRPGDIVLLQSGDQPMLHRFLGLRRRRGQTWLLTAGDQNRHLDPAWPARSLWGRAVAFHREDQYLPMPTGQWQSWRLRLRVALWAVAGYLRLLISPVMPLVLFAVIVETGWAAVTLVSFDVEWVGDRPRVTWETASEVDSIGFYVLRSDQEGGSYQHVTDLIPAEGDLIGAAYEWIDDTAAPGKAYYYKLEDVSASGGSTLSDSISLEAITTATFTPTPEPTATATSTPEPTATATPLPSSTPTATATSLPSLTPTTPPTHTPPPSLTPSATATVPPAPASTATPVAPPTSTSTAQIVNTLPHTAEPSATLGQDPLYPSAIPTQLPTLVPSLTSQPVSTTPAIQSMPSASPAIMLQPSPTATQMAMVMAPPPDGESGPAEPPGSSSPGSVDEEELARAKRRLTLSLIGIGGAIGGVLLLIVLALIVFALYQWGFLRSGY